VAPKKKGAAVGGGRKTPPCKRDAGVEAAANEHANAHKYIYTPTHSGEEENISSSNLVYNKSNFITLFFMHATGYMASVWLTDEHTNTQDPHTHTQAHSTEIFQAHLVGFVLWRAHFGVGGIITRIDIVATSRKRIQLLRTRLNVCIQIYFSIICTYKYNYKIFYKIDFKLF